MEKIVNELKNNAEKIKDTAIVLLVTAIIGAVAGTAFGIIVIEIIKRS